LRIHPSTIIFDYGQVLCLPQPIADRLAMAAVVRMPQTEFDTTYWQFRPAYDEAALDPETYWNKVAQRKLPGSDILQVTEIDNESWIHSEPVMTEWARQLRAAGMRTAILSNMPLPVREHLDLAAWLPEFDHRTFSCDVRLAKPGAEIYQLCLQGLGAAPSDTLFLDDRPENIRAAEALGIHSILFTTPADLAEQLDRRFATPAPLIATVK
jgi:putative hydrolase of the HAD superfamily